MTYLLGLGMAVISSLLCQWILNHVYIGYEWKSLDEPDSKGNYNIKVWNKKLTIRRWIILAIWFICGLLNIVSLVVPLFIAIVVAIHQYADDCHFKCDSKITRWLNEEL